MLDIFRLFNFDFLSLFSWQVISLIAFAIFWLALASIQDLKRREVENWWSISLVVVVMAFRAFWSVQDLNIWPFLWGLMGLVFGFALANLFYYARMFAAGDFKLLINICCSSPKLFEF